MCAKCQYLSVGDVAGRLNPSGKRIMGLMWFYCDESYESKSTSRTYVVAGFAAEEKVWRRIEKRWVRTNNARGITRFHASHLNALDHEFTGWSPQRSKRYTKALIKILADQKLNLNAIGVGIMTKDYEATISAEGRKKFGHPYLVCFKSCVSHIALTMDKVGVADDWKFSVIFDRNEFEDEAERIFYAMKDDVRYKYRHRLGTCTRGTWKEFVALEVADLIAYETYRYLHGQNFGNKDARKAIAKLFSKNAFSSYYYDIELLRDIKEEIESAECGDNGFIPILTRN